MKIGEGVFAPGFFRAAGAERAAMWSLEAVNDRLYRKMVLLYLTWAQGQLT